MATMLDQGQDNVFHPDGCVVLSFPGKAAAARAVRELATIGLRGESIRPLSDRQMRERLEIDMASAWRLRLATDVDWMFARERRRLARRGHHWLIVRARNDGRAWQVADCVRSFGPSAVHYYGLLGPQDLTLAEGDAAAWLSAWTPPPTAGAAGGGAATSVIDRSHWGRR